MIGGLDAVRILELGFHGFAFLMAFLGFLLLRRLITQRDQQTAPKDVDVLRMRLQGVKVFLLVSVIFLVAGGALEIVRQVVKPRFALPITISPSTVPEYLTMPVVAKDDQELTLTQGYVRTEIAEDNSIRVLMEELVEQAKMQNEALRRFSNLLVPSSSEGGL